MIKSSVYRIGRRVENDLPIIKGQVGGRRVGILVDTGSSVSIMNACTFRELKESIIKVKEGDTDIALRGITGQEIPTEGWYMLTF